MIPADIRSPSGPRLSDRARSLSFFVSAMAVLILGCSPRSTPPPPSQALPAVGVAVQRAERKSYLLTEDVVGTVRAKNRAVVAAKVVGRIERMAANPGDSVKAGQLLVQLDAGEIQAKLDQSKAVLEQAENDLRRFTKLNSQSAVTPAEFEAIASRQRVARAAVVEAQILREFAQVLAPFEAVVTRKLADTGDLATVGKPLLELEDAAHLRLEIDLPESLLPRARLGDKLPVRIGSMAEAIAASVSEIAPAGDADSRTFRVKLDLPADERLRSGQFGRVEIPVGESAALRVPLAAVLKRGQLEFCFVVTNQAAHLRIVKSGKVIGQEIEILSGLTDGETIAVSGLAGLVDLQPVTVQP